MVSEKAPLGKVYNAGPALPTSIREVVERTAKALGVPFDQLCEVYWRSAWSRFALLARLFGDQARYRLGAADRLGRGLAEMVAWAANISTNSRLGQPAILCVREEVGVDATIATLRRNSLDVAAARRRCLGYRPPHSRYFAAGRCVAHCAGVLLHRNHRHSLQQPDAPGDRWRISRRLSDVQGHGCMIQYVILEEQGVLSRSDLDAYCKPNGVLARIPITRRRELPRRQGR